jgi:enoyl-CoA hydratase/carnithine racemase
MVRALHESVHALAQQAAPTALVIGAVGGKSFCAGADLKERLAMTLDETRGFLDELGELLSSLERFPAPVIAAMSGSALGGGFELALACDVRVAADHIQMGLPEVRLGIIPGAGGTQRLARLAGIGVAKDMILTGRRLDAVTAERLGLISRAVPATGLEAEVGRIVAQLQMAGPLALAQAKKAINEGFALPLPQALILERAAYEVVLKSADRNEGLLAYSQKRPPNYTGR